MNEKTVQLIEKLAQKLGTSSEFIWATLIKQAQISAMGGILFFVLFIVIVFMVTRLYNRKPEIFIDEYGDFTFSGIITAVCIICFGLFSCFVVFDAMTALFNPEYWALKTILNHIKQ